MAQTEERGRWVRRRCPVCGGEGAVAAPAAPAPASESEDPATAPAPVSCAACGGRGTVRVPLTPAEYRLLRRKRLWRGIGLVILGMIPFFCLLGAILAQPEMLCGRPWYGVGLLLLLVAAGHIG